MTASSIPETTSIPMTIGRPIGPNLGVTVSADVEATLADSEVTFAGLAPDEGTARGVHWLTQMSRRESEVAYKNNPGGGRSSIWIIDRTDDQGRTWSCVTSPWWSAGLFLSHSEAHDFAVEVAKREAPSEGWDSSL